MKRYHGDEAGALALVTVLLLPLVLTVLAGAVELGAVRVVVERARIAADLATLTAMNDQDDGELARSGSLRPAADADRVARDMFALNIEPLSASLASTPSAIAGAADVVVVGSGERSDPLTGAVYQGPTIRLSADLPIRTPVFAALVGRAVTVVRVLSASSAR